MKYNKNILLKLIYILLFSLTLIIIIRILLSMYYKKIEPLEKLFNNGSDAFCNTKKGFDLEKSCNNLTKNNCNKTHCCIWGINNIDKNFKCYAGNENGLLFNTNSNGKTNNLETYYYNDKCYGKCN